MKKKFDMSGLGLLWFYLGIEVRPDSSGIALHQTHYAKHILELGGMTGYNLAHTPMEERLKLNCDSTIAKVDITLYRRIIGSLRCLVHTRLDLALIVGYASLFMEWPMEEHMVAVKRILCYVAGTLCLGCHYGRIKEALLLGTTLVTSLAMWIPRRVHLGTLGYNFGDLTGDVDT